MWCRSAAFCCSMSKRCRGRVWTYIASAQRRLELLCSASSATYRSALPHICHQLKRQLTQYMQKVLCNIIMVLQGYFLTSSLHEHASQSLCKMLVRFVRGYTWWIPPSKLLKHHRQALNPLPGAGPKLLHDLRYCFISVSAVLWHYYTGCLDLMYQVPLCYSP